MIIGGWEWAQTYTTTSATESPVITYYQLEYKPYLTIQSNIISTLFLQNLWVNELTFDLDQFTTNIFLSLIWNENFELCFGTGWETE